MKYIPLRLYSTFKMVQPYKVDRYAKYRFILTIVNYEMRSSIIRSKFFSTFVIRKKHLVYYLIYLLKQAIFKIFPIFNRNIYLGLPFGLIIYKDQSVLSRDHFSNSSAFYSCFTIVMHMKLDIAHFLCSISQTMANIFRNLFCNQRRRRERVEREREEAERRADRDRSEGEFREIWRREVRERWVMEELGRGMKPSFWNSP